MRRLLPALLLCLALPAADARASGADPHAAAIALARSGQHEAALVELRRLRARDPDNLALRHDTIVVLSWAQRDDEALALAGATPLDRAPPYVLEAIARSARNARQFELAQTFYRTSLRRDPARLESRIGFALAQSDLGQYDSARSLLEPLMARPGARPELFDAYGEVAAAEGDWPAALAAHQRALKLDPERTESLRGVARSARALGAPQFATALAARRPGLLPEEELAALAVDVTAFSVRFGRTEERIGVGSARYAWLDRALARSESAAARIAQDAGAAARASPTERRLLADRVFALSLRNRPREAVALHAAMSDARLEMPAYAIRAAAGARLEIREPQAALALYERVLADSPDDFDAGLGRFYALVESERLAEAARHADALAARTPRWLSHGRPNPESVSARTAAVLARLYGDRLEEAERGARALRDEAPFNAQVREANASIAQARGRPRLADEEFRRALAVEPDSAALRAARVEPLLAVNAFGEAQSALRDAIERRPEDPRIRRAGESWERHNRRQLELWSGYGRSGSASPVGSDDWRLDARAYTRPLVEHWRLFAQASMSRARFEDGDVRWHREGLGAEYRMRDLRALAALTAGSGDRAGVQGQLDWTPGDRWGLGLQGSTVSANVPMQAWRAGIRASELGAQLRHTWHESRFVQATLTTLGFSDGNDRIAAELAWQERWLSTPSLRLESMLSYGASRNDATGRPYFNPSGDRTASLQLSADWLTWRRYERAFRQRLTGTLGHYAQQGFEGGPILGLLYEHVWEIDRALDLRYGIGRSLRPYDGVETGRTFGSVWLDWRF
jgi:biofilm PGA synthesis protein PgaA